MGKLQPTAVQRASAGIQYSCFKKGRALSECSPLHFTSPLFQWSMLPGNCLNSKSILISFHMYSKCIIQAFNIFLNSLWVLRTIRICLHSVFAPPRLFTHSFVFSISSSSALREDKATARSGAPYQSLPAGACVLSSERLERTSRFKGCSHRTHPYVRNN